MDSINLAMMQLKLTNPNYESDLLALYYPTVTQIPFSISELEYIKAAEPIVVACPAYLQPLSYTRSTDGKLTGIYIDLMEQIADISGLSFT